jgi:drug/metabolite transporter (DMT)-like permease
MISNANLAGSGLLVLSSTAFSMAGLFTRLINLDVWTILFWRGLFGGAVIFAFMAIREKGGVVAAMRAMGVPGLAVAMLSTVATIAFIHALRIGSVADVMIIAATLPFVAAGMAWVWYGERAHWTTLAASLASIAGIALMAGMPGGARNLFGDALAFVMPVAIGAMMVVMRRYRHTSMLPAVALSALLCPVVVWPLAQPLSVRGLDIVYLMLFGALQFGAGLVTLTLGLKLVSATRAALIANIETPLGIALVWGAIGERPATATMVGGAVVMLAVIGDVLASKPERTGSI